MSKKIINVVAAAIEKDGKIFCAQRPEGKSLGGYWEFPGGKLEEGESPEQALIREINEELNSKIEIISFVNEASYDYDFGTVVMKTCFWKSRFVGTSGFNLARAKSLENFKLGTCRPTSCRIVIKIRASQMWCSYLLVM